MPSQHEPDLAWLKEDVIHHADWTNRRRIGVLLACSG
jgi:hypothetical protein